MLDKKRVLGSGAQTLEVSAIGFGAMGMHHGFGPNPGDYTPPPPNFSTACNPEWSHVAPFCMSHAQEFRKADGPCRGARRDPVRYCGKLWPLPQ